MGNKAALSALFLGFLMLWVPLGQHGFLYQHWMKVGTFMAPFLLLTALAFHTPRTGMRNARVWALVLWLAYIAHQFEEHWIDLLGRHYAFKPALNEILTGLAGTPSETEILSDASVFVINTSLVWLVAALAIWRGSTHIFPTLCMASIVFVNAISHCVVALISMSYNPGLLTGLVLFLPLGSFVYFWLFNAGQASVKQCGFSLLWGIAGHLLMMVGLLILSRFDQPSELPYFAVLIVWSVLPCFLFRPERQQ
ncbi:MAG: HXXEE domain-containing protein [Pseudomonadota bacterium]